jgi:hypothetical protein
VQAAQILASFRKRGIQVVSDGVDLMVRPTAKLTIQDRQAIRSNKSDLIAHLRDERNITPDSRHPLIGPEVRAKIEAIEPDARAKGWPAELLWNNAFWDLPRGLAAALDDDDEIVEVTPDHIKILKCRRDVLRFLRHVG